MRDLVAGCNIVIACGPGGVGKTTTAAALGAEVARTTDRRVLVVTVDPAKRLATALGLQGIGNDERQVDPALLTIDEVAPRGELWASMLDTKASWDALIHRHAPDAETASQILANPLYQNITGRFVGSHDYIAMERLYELASSKRFDLIVVDTPPTRNALDFLDAPERLADFFSSRLLRWLIAPYKSRLFNVAARPFNQIADRILGRQFLSDIAAFFMLLQTMYPGFVERSKAVSALLHEEGTAFIVVSSLETTPAREAEFFATELGRRKFDLGAIVFNKVLPPTFVDPTVVTSARLLAERAAEVAPMLNGDAAVNERVLREVASTFADFALAASGERRARMSFKTVCDLVVALPYLDEDVTDVNTLMRLGARLVG